MSKKEANTIVDFEKYLQELESIVERMDKGEQSLEENIKDFERGMQLSTQCQQSLQQAQLKVDALIKKQSEYTLENFESE